MKSRLCSLLRIVVVLNSVNVLFQTAESLAESQDVEAENQRSFICVLDALKYKYFFDFTGIPFIKFRYLLVVG